MGGEASGPIDKEVESSEGDREFIRQVRSLIEERMTDSGFKIGELSDCMNMSRSSFYNKIKEIPGMLLRTMCVMCGSTEHWFC